MDGIKHSGRFAEMERLVNDYFNCHIAPVMSKTRTDLIRNQGEEMKEYSTSLGGILSMMASSAQPMSDPYQTLKVTGEWNSKTTEDYIEMCKMLVNQHYQIWDYRGRPGNFLGQICPAFTLLWIPVALMAMGLYRWLDWRLDRMLGV